LTDVKKGSSDASLLTLLKEGVCAALGVLIVGGTIWLLWSSLSGPTRDLAAAQGIFSILGGWGGVVIGYYFGRLPAERIAAKAEEAAESAIKTQQVALSDSATSVAQQQEKYKKLMGEIDALISSLGEG
jgi:hypothetical protein